MQDPTLTQTLRDALAGSRDSRLSYNEQVANGAPRGLIWALVDDRRALVEVSKVGPVIVQGYWGLVFPQRVYLTFNQIIGVKNEED